MDFKAVTAFCAAAGLSKSTNPYPVKHKKHGLAMSDLNNSPKTNNVLGRCRRFPVTVMLSYMLHVVHLTVIQQEHKDAHLYICWWFYPGWPWLTQFFHICEDRKKENQDQWLQADSLESTVCMSASPGVPRLPTGAHTNTYALCQFRRAAFALALSGEGCKSVPRSSVPQTALQAKSILLQAWICTTLTELPAGISCTNTTKVAF